MNIHDEMRGGPSRQRKCEGPRWKGVESCLGRLRCVRILLRLLCRHEHLKLRQVPIKILCTLIENLVSRDFAEALKATPCRLGFQVPPLQKCRHLRFGRGFAFSLCHPRNSLELMKINNDSPEIPGPVQA